MSKHTTIISPLRGVLAAGCLLTLCGAGIFSAGCNPNTIQPLDSQGTRQLYKPLSASGQVPMDILWVVDNSFSMCQEQKVLRDNFQNFVDIITRSNIDFHIALTTTHAPESAGNIEPIAREAHIQSTPQPVPGNNQSCLRGEGEGTQFAPLRESLEAAKTCLADPSIADQYQWSDPQIDCALQSPTQQTQSGCVAASSLPDTTGDGRHDVFDLFPSSSAYRAIPKVLKASDYRMADGSFDTVQLTRDFSCMSLVGTRGDGYEKGLRAAVKAVSLEMTGGFVGDVNADTSAPNHGFIREKAGFATIFVTDENDCSHDSSITELGNSCGANICEYMNSPQAEAAGENHLVSTSDLANMLRDNLEATKRLPAAESLNEELLFMASIHGTANPYNGYYPEELKCDPNNKPELSPVCTSRLGEASSGDRYERFTREFANYYPNSVPRTNEAGEIQYEPRGWMCSDDFTPALEGIANFIDPGFSGCIDEPVISCSTNADCPSNAFAGTPGTCITQGAQQGFCDSGVALTIERDPALDALIGEIEQVDYCLPGSIGELDTPNVSCVLDPMVYQLEACGDDGSGFEIVWRDDITLVNQKISGYGLGAYMNLDSSR